MKARAKGGLELFNSNFATRKLYKVCSSTNSWHFLAFAKMSCAAENLAEQRSGVKS